MNDERRKLRAIVTAGGTKEALDDVRYLTNFSSGKFGYEIARQLAAAGCQTTVICPAETPLLAGGAIPGVQHRPFTDTDSLQRELTGQPGADIIFHAAAVSDYRPANRLQGKLASDAEELVIRLERTPKIIDSLRAAFGQKTVLVGFKLLSGVPWRELVRRARDQNARCRLNLTVANDLRQLGAGRHPATLVTIEGGAIRLDGTREETARQLVDFVLKRAAVDWFRTEWMDQPAALDPGDRQRFARLLALAQQSGLLFDASGNVSTRCGNGIIVTPRQVDKGTVSADQACLAAVDLDSRLIRCQGPVKSSIDTGVQAMIYRRFPAVGHLLHFHSPWGHFSRRTAFPYPCGTVQEGSEILTTLDNGPNGDEAASTDEFALELIHHGALLGLTDAGIARLEDEWAACIAAYARHLAEVGQSDKLGDGRLRPIFSDASIVGVVLELDGGEAVSVFLSEAARGRGVGWRVVRQIIARQLAVKTIDACGVLNFYAHFGFKVELDDRTGMYTLHPPAAPATDELFAR